ncbi:MAG: hypothetical protein JKX78_07120 [Alteromonadaceae bacterium]|nr:hypothetical protein [Alteromonadaceae bacterium]
MAKKTDEIISQAELDNLLMLNDFIDKNDDKSLVSELKKAILDSGKLELAQWLALRKQLLEIEELIPHVDLIIKLKKE